MESYLVAERVEEGIHKLEDARDFAVKLDPAGLDVHVVLSNYSTHKTALIHRWLLKRPRFHLHFTPTNSSWLNLVERWFGLLSEKQIRRGSHRSTWELERVIYAYLGTARLYRTAGLGRGAGDLVYSVLESPARRSAPRRDLPELPESAMSQWKSYYDRVKNSRPESALRFAISQVDRKLPRVATDCGCGAGNEIEFLVRRGFEVVAFDADEASVRMCRARFEGEDSVRISQATFLTFAYPGTALTVATLSLFFSPREDFEPSWARLAASIPPGGVFCGTFLGPNDDWEDLLVHHSEEEVLALFDQFHVIERRVREFEQKRPEGHREHRHQIQIIAKRRAI